MLVVFGRELTVLLLLQMPFITILLVVDSEVKIERLQRFINDPVTNSIPALFANKRTVILSIDSIFHSSIHTKYKLARDCQHK